MAAAAMAAMLGACEAREPGPAARSDATPTPELHEVMAANAEAQALVAAGDAPPAALLQRAFDRRVLDAPRLWDVADMQPLCGGAHLTVGRLLTRGAAAEPDDVLTGLTFVLDCLSRLGPLSERFIAMEPTSLGNAQVIPTADMVRGDAISALTLLIEAAAGPEADKAMIDAALDLAATRGGDIGLLMIPDERTALSQGITAARERLPQERLARLEALERAVKATPCGVLCTQGRPRWRG